MHKGGGLSDQINRRLVKKERPLVKRNCHTENSVVNEGWAAEGFKQSETVNGKEEQKAPTRNWTSQKAHVSMASGVVVATAVKLVVGRSRGGCR